MEKPTLFVRGNINSEGYVSCRDIGASIRPFEKEEDYDLSESAVVDGDMFVKDMMVFGGLVVATGNIYANSKRKEG